MYLYIKVKKDIGNVTVVVVISSPFLENNLGFIIQGHGLEEKIKYCSTIKVYNNCLLFYLYLKAP